jgi:hypothetical protein
MIEPVHNICRSEEFIKHSVRVLRQTIAIPLGRYDDLQRTASVQNRAGEHLVRAVG